MFVPTKSSLLKRKTEDSCATVIFKGKRNVKLTAPEIQYKKTELESEMKQDKKSDLKKLRYEVIKFGSSGFDGSKKKESRVALAVALGAKPPKGECRNYKKILAEKSAEKQRGSGVREHKHTKPVLRRGTSTWRKPAANRIGGLLNSYGKVKPAK